MAKKSTWLSLTNDPSKQHLEVEVATVAVVHPHHDDPLRGLVVDSWVEATVATTETVIVIVDDEDDE
eukprot:m.56981 g.56981  ORF g.56981 m.56981 type:complete len:67 (+) comp22326_c0_seq1:792-992(+)